ncbi:MAG: hypothetical protein RLZZ501_1336 [Pseudomonadota bacterium]|jgi:spermidine/putrescine transport system substrate-binding protein
MIRRRAGPWLLAVLLAAVVLAGPAGAGGGELRVLARAGALSPALLARFEQQNGIRVRLVEVNEPGEISRRLDHPGAGYDVALLLDHQAAELIGRGRLERVWADRLAGFWNVEDPWRSRPFDPRNEYTVPHQWGTTGLAIDSSVHPGDHDSLTLLFSPPPDLVGRIALLDDPVMVQLALLAAGEPHCAADPHRLQQVENRLAPLLARARLVRADRIQAALRDHTLALVVAWSGDVMRARRSRPGLAFAYPREGNPVWSEVAAVPRDPPNRAGALKFLAFLLRPDNAALESEGNGFATVIRGAEDFLRPEVLAAPELVAPWPAKVVFQAPCETEVQRRQEAAWVRLRSQVRGRRPPPPDG